MHLVNYNAPEVPVLAGIPVKVEHEPGGAVCASRRQYPLYGCRKWAVMGWRSRIAASAGRVLGTQT